MSFAVDSLALREEAGPLAPYIWSSVNQYAFNSTHPHIIDKKDKPPVDLNLWVDKTSIHSTSLILGTSLVYLEAFIEK